MTQVQKFWLSLGVILFFTFLYSISGILMPFITAGFFAYIGNPLVKHLCHLKLPRTLAVSFVFVLIMAIVTVGFVFLVPLLSREVSLLVQQIPSWISWFQAHTVPWINRNFHVDLSWGSQDLNTVITQHWKQASNVISVVWETVANSSVALIGWSIKIALIPVVTFYLLRDWDTLIGQMRAMIPKKWAPQIIQIISECDEVLSAFLRGQFLVILVLGLFYSIGLWLIGLDLALLIGSITGVLTLIPFLGYSVGLIISCVAAFVQFHTMISVLYVLIVFVVGYMLENFLLVPWLVGDRIGLHPITVIFAVLVGGHLFGFVGVLVALPVAAIIMVMVRHLKNEYLSSQLYQR